MEVRALPIAGAWLFVPRQHPDARGVFLEQFKADAFRDAIGHRFEVAQINVSVSCRGTLRGLHYADVPLGQAKYVSCQRGAVLDAIVDIRVGSPTFGEIVTVQLDDVGRRAVYIAEGLGHAFFALTDDATLCYLCSTGYNPGAEHGTHPLDPAIAWSWPTDAEPVLSAKDEAAPTLAAAAAAGLLPNYADCVRRYEELRSG